ncbi:PE family protein [Mycobacterium sp. E796]|uniref:PE family protein n=1 Tax=Mycobacterium sp. E796 TaxID=1834151 RepID=UPI00080122E7|nr:PE family protein [Mycobacterium sp. E796]OBI46055.1 hypothetical protein A5706_30455 [Mycobacterium sp. E796]
MSFVIAQPELVQAAAQNLAGIRSALGEASAAAAGPTTGVVAAAQDEVSGAVAALFDSLGQEYQAINAQAQAFHAQFVNLMNAGAGAYLSSEAANAKLIEGGAAAATSDPLGIAGPYESLAANTVSNLQGIGNTWATVTAPAVFKAMSTYTNPQLILGALQTGNPLPILSTTGQFALGSANIFRDLIVPASLSVTSINPPSFAVGLGLPEVLAFDALGAPVNAGLAASLSGAAFLEAVGTGNPLAAFTAFVDAPANIANAFLNGERTLPLLLAPGLTADVPFSGLLVPVQPFTTTASLLGTSVTVSGPPVGGLIPALLNFAPQLLASSFGG